MAAKYTLHDVTNGNGQKLIQFAQIHDMFVVSTKYKYKTVHKGTHTIPGKMETNQIDHVLINKILSSKMLDQCEKPNCDSDHFLVRVQHKEKIHADKHKKERKGMKKNWII